MPMPVQQTFSIIKPDAVARSLIGAIQSRFESEALRIVACRLTRLDREQAEGFYAEHKDRPFFASLVEYMTSGPLMVQVLQGEDAISRNRQIMGATNPEDAEPGTLRAEHAESIDRNSVHGSDSETSAEREIAFFFSKGEIFTQF